MRLKTKALIDPEGFMYVMLDKNLGTYGMAKLLKVSSNTVNKILDGQPIAMRTAASLFNALERDARIKIQYVNDVGSDYIQKINASDEENIVTEHFSDFPYTKNTRMSDGKKNFVRTMTS